MSYRICFAAYRSYFSPANTGGGVRCLPTIQVGCYWEHLPLPSQYISYSLDKYPILSYMVCVREHFLPPLQFNYLLLVKWAMLWNTLLVSWVMFGSTPPPFNFMSRI